MMRPVAAFAEAGKPPQVPGPLVRVPAGTRVRITVRNGLAEPLRLFGLGAQRGPAADSIVVAPGAEVEVRFDATTPGVYYYAGKTGEGPLLGRLGKDSQLNGAIVIDAPGARSDDRLFLMSWWFGLDSTTVSGLAPGGTFAINGLSWPHTERLHAAQGDELDWRWINLTDLDHPMHLHGFYFRVTGGGDGATWRDIAPEARQLAVTEIVRPGTTMAMHWTPQRAGNWIFHCHFAGHMTSMDGLNKDRRHPDDVADAHATNGASVHDQHYMAGLILGIEVTPTGAAPAPTAAARSLRLFVRSKAHVYGPYAGYGYALGGTPEEGEAHAFTIPGPTLVLWRNEPVSVTIINQSHDKAAVHWHGIELESFTDGVPGFSGYGTSLLPAIPPGDSLTVRFTPPRAGTFMYHSHFNEFQQLGSGMYGAIVVLDSGETHARDRPRAGRQRRRPDPQRDPGTVPADPAERQRDAAADGAARGHALPPPRHQHPDGLPGGRGAAGRRDPGHVADDRARRRRPAGGTADGGTGDAGVRPRADLRLRVHPGEAGGPHAEGRLPGPAVPGAGERDGGGHRALGRRAPVTRRE
jgi:FtsP/CotA-like multicopper oxidase with cupredoxin domain